MDLQTIERLDHASVNKLTSDQYREAFDDQTTGVAFRKRIDEIENGPKSPSRPTGSVRQADAPSPRTDFSGDPSWADEPSVAAPAADSAPAELVQPVATAKDFSDLPERIHEYQPTITNKKDGKSTPVGGIQRFKYRTVDDPNDPNSLVLQLQRAHAHASARIRELSRSRKLEEIAAAGSTAKNVTPSKEVPTTVAELAAELIQQREQNFLLSVREALNSFQLSADWAKYRSNENAESIVLAVQKAGADPTDPQSFHEAFARMREFLVPVTAEQVTAPTPASTPAPTPAPVQAAAATASAPTQRVAIATGISSVDSFNTEAPAFESVNNVQGVRLNIDGKTQIIDLKFWDRLPSDQQRKILKVPSNARAIDALYENAEVARRARR